MDCDWDFHLVQATGANVIDKTAHARLVWNEWAGLDAGDRLPHILVQIGERLERKGRPDANLRLDLAFDLIVLEGQHAAVGVVNEDDLVSAQQPLRDDQGADGVVGCYPAGVAYDVGLTLLEAEDLVNVEAGVHAGKHGDVLCRRHRQVTFLERPGIAFVVADQLFGDAHGHKPRESADGFKTRVNSAQLQQIADEQCPRSTASRRVRGIPTAPRIDEPERVWRAGRYSALQCRIGILGWMYEGCTGNSPHRSSGPPNSNQPGAVVAIAASCR